MSTRSAIARPNGEGFLGRYHHWDGYPEGLGATLYWLAQGNEYRAEAGLPPTPWDGNVEQMLHVLLDEHPAGWSTINDADFRVAPGYVDLADKTGDWTKNRKPECYCHGARSEEGWDVDEKNASDSGCEYAYVIDAKTRMMTVLSSYTESGVKMIGAFGMGDPNGEWKPIAVVPFDAEEPDWEKLEPSDGVGSP